MYQEQFTVSNSANTAKVVSFSMPPEFKTMVNIFPKTGYVQAHSSMKTMIKFQPDEVVISDMNENEIQYFDPETGVIEIPITLKVADQGKDFKFKNLVYPFTRKIDIF